MNQFCYKTHAAQGNELVTDNVELNCCVLEDEPYLQSRLPTSAKSGNEPALFPQELDQGEDVESGPLFDVASVQPHPPLGDKSRKGGERRGGFRQVIFHTSLTIGHLH